MDSAHGGRGEAGAARACPCGLWRAVGACGAAKWSGGPVVLRRASVLSRGRGARVRSEATVGVVGAASSGAWSSPGAAEGAAR